MVFRNGSVSLLCQHHILFFPTFGTSVVVGSSVLTFTIVVGQKEQEDEAVNIRNRDDEVQGREETVKLKDAVTKLLKLKEDRSSIPKLE